jgi:acetolactate synthase-1/2/3 large subunit
VVATLLGISAFPEDHFLYAGWPGMHGMAYASLAIDEADLLIALGMRFDDRITGDCSKFAPNAKVIHVDVDPSEIGKSVRVDVPIVGDVKQVLRQMNPLVEDATRMDWIRRIEELKTEHPSLSIRETEKLIPQYVIRELHRATNGEAIVVTGVGQHQMWAAQHYQFSEPRSLVSSGGAGSMGFEVPAALGAQVGRPDKVVWSVAGDGGFQMTMSELATLVENNIPVKFAIINNGRLGMVRQWQQAFYDESYVATVYSANPDFVKLAEAFGAFGIRVTDKAQVASAIAQAMEFDGPAVVDFLVEQNENVYPFIPSGKTVADMVEEPKPERVSK